MKILFAKGNSQYGALRDYADILIKELTLRGHQIVVVDRKKIGDWENVHNIIDGSFDIVFSLQVLAFKIKDILQQKGIEFPKLKYVSICGDHPIYIHYWLRKMEGCQNGYLLVNDKNQYSYLKKYYPDINSILFMSLFGSGNNLKNYSERKYDVYFGGTYYNADKNYEIIQQYPEEQRNIAEAMIDYIKKNEGMTLQRALELVLEDRGMRLNINEFTDYLEQFSAIDMYMRGCYRNYFIESALKSNAVVTVCGNGWEQSPYIQYSNFNYIGNVEVMEDAYKNMSDSKIIINVMPWSFLCFHERIANILKCGAICLTNSNYLVEEVFSDGEDIITVGLNDGQKIEDTINYLLENEEYAKKIAMQGEIKGSSYFSLEEYCNQLEEQLYLILNENS